MKSAKKPPYRGVIKSGRLRYFAYQMLMYRDGGEKCSLCGIEGKEDTLLIHHKDGNPRNNADANLALCCSSCNMLEIWRVRQPKLAESRDVMTLPLPTVREGERENIRAGLEGIDAARSTHLLGMQNASAEIRLNREKEPMFRRWVAERVLENGSVGARDIINAGAEKFHISQQTTGRYLDKLVSSVGNYTVLKGREGEDIVSLKKEAWEKLEIEDDVNEYFFDYFKDMDITLVNVDRVRNLLAKNNPTISTKRLKKESEKILQYVLSKRKEAS